jgi:hypothetical protein
MIAALGTAFPGSDEEPDFDLHYQEQGKDWFFYKEHEVGFRLCTDSHHRMIEIVTIHKKDYYKYDNKFECTCTHCKKRREKKREKIPAKRTS